MLKIFAQPFVVQAVAPPPPEGGEKFLPKNLHGIAEARNFALAFEGRPSEPGGGGRHGMLKTRLLQKRTKIFGKKFGSKEKFVLTLRRFSPRERGVPAKNIERFAIYK